MWDLCLSEGDGKLKFLSDCDICVEVRASVLVFKKEVHIIVFAGFIVGTACIYQQEQAQIKKD